MIRFELSIRLTLNSHRLIDGQNFFCIQKVVSYTMCMCKAVAPMLICALMERAGFLTVFLVSVCSFVHRVLYKWPRCKKTFFCQGAFIYTLKQLRLCKITAPFPGKPTRT